MLNNSLIKQLDDTINKIEKAVKVVQGMPDPDYPKGCSGVHETPTAEDQTFEHTMKPPKKPTGPTSKIMPTSGKVLIRTGKDAWGKT